MKPIKSSEILLKHMDLQNPRPGKGELFVDESGAYWLYNDGCYHKVSSGNPFKKEVPGQLIFIDGRLYTIANDGQLILYDIPDMPNEDQTDEDQTGGA